MLVNQRNSVDPEQDILPGSNVQATVLFRRGVSNPASPLRTRDQNSSRDQDISTDSSMKSISINLPWILNYEIKNRNMHFETITADNFWRFINMAMNQS